MARALRGLATEAAGKHVPWGALGTGNYTAATKGCFDVIARCAPLMEEAVRRALSARAASGAADAAAPFAIADFGAADAGTSLPLLRQVVATVRAAEPRAPIVVHYEDQAMNDWQSVFRLTHGDLPGGPATYMDGSVGNVFVLASGASFYQQCFAPASIDVAFCATAMHWLTAVRAGADDRKRRKEEKEKNDPRIIWNLAAGGAPRSPPGGPLRGRPSRSHVIARAAPLRPSRPSVTARAVRLSDRTDPCQVPCEIPDALHSACSADAPTRAAFATQAAADWETILLHRAAELKPGGQMVCAPRRRRRRRCDGMLDWAEHRGAAPSSFFVCFVLSRRRCSIVTAVPRGAAVVRLRHRFRDLWLCKALFKHRRAHRTVPRRR